MLAACVNQNVKQADTMARSGDWEGALVNYKLAYAMHPDDVGIVHKIDFATGKVIALYTKRGNDANAAGKLGDAGNWWQKAVDLCDPLAGYPPEKSQAYKAIDHNQAALEYYGDVAVTEKRYEDAVGVYGAILKVHAERVDLVQKHLQVQRAFAQLLQDKADDLAKQNLLGAALINDLRALQHDPMQPRAFTAGNDLKKTLRSKTRVDVPELKLDDKGFHGLGAMVIQKMAPHLDDVAPYGPTRDPAAIQASLKATIVKFDKTESHVDGVDHVANDEAPSNVPIDNPAIPEQQQKIAVDQRQLADLQAKLKDASKKPQNPAGLELARQVDAMRSQVLQEKQALAQMPAKVPAPPPPPTWDLPWTDTTRTVEATIRFELTEPDFAQPITLDVTHRISKTDRSHAGSSKHDVAADPLTLPSYEQMTADLAAQFGDGVAVLQQARDRRVARLIDTAHQQLGAGHEAEALDAYVEVLFISGPGALPDDAAAFVARSMEHDEFKDIVAVN
jgi:tetratricopeptide (TPR) repeat protein